MYYFTYLGWIHLQHTLIGKNARTCLFASRLGYAYGVSDKSMAHSIGNRTLLASFTLSTLIPSLIPDDYFSQRHLCPTLYAAAKFAIFCVLAKNRKNHKVDDFSRWLAIVRSSWSVNDISRKRVADFAKIAKNRKADDFSRSPASFCSSVLR